MSKRQSQRLYRLLCLMIMTVLFWGISSLNSFAQQPAGVNEQKRAIPFKPEPTISDVADTKLVVGLLVLFAIAIPALYYLKKNYPSLTTVHRHGAKVKTIETRILTPRLKLYLIEVNGEEILLAHSSEGVTQVSLRHPQITTLKKDNNESDKV